MWRIFSKKNRNYTIGGVLAFVVIVFLIYKYVLKGTMFGETVRGAMLGEAGWEEKTYQAPHYSSGPIRVAEGGTGRTAAEAIVLSGTS